LDDEHHELMICCDGQYITWISNNKVAWTLNAAGVGPNTESEISARPIPQEPMVGADLVHIECVLMQNYSTSLQTWECLRTLGLWTWPTLYSRQSCRWTTSGCTSQKMLSTLVATHRSSLPRTILRCTASLTDCSASKSYY
jgi:hypothetical protein